MTAGRRAGRHRGGGARRLRPRSAGQLLCAAAVVAGIVLVSTGGGSGRTAQAGGASQADLTAPATTETTALEALVPIVRPVVAGSDAAPPRRQLLAASSLAIPALAVTASIGTAPVVDGVLEPPRDPARVGLWAGSASLDATTGTVTIAGHVNWAGMGPFAFAQLATLRAGARIDTSAADGTQQRWRVTSVWSRPKSTGIDRTAFAGPSGPRVLVLVTCGGTFDAGASSYVDNVYVRAVLVR